MSDDQFTKLFKYIEDFRTDVHKRFEIVSRDQADIHDAMLRIAKETGVKLSVDSDSLPVPA